jgi:hypothetical protein
MAFRNTDLMTKVLPQLAIDAAQLAKYCLFQTHICRWPTLCHISCIRILSNCGHCSLVGSIPHGCQVMHSCGPGNSACDPTQYCFGSDPYVIQDLEDLVTIRADLTATLKQLDAIEKELPSGITTKAQADELEASLKQQLEHLKTVRAGLK